MNVTNYSDPEMATERKLCRRIVAKIMKDPCRYCTNRHPETAWDRTFCKVDGRTWWACKDGKTLPTFELDLAEIGDAT